ncbi:MAG: AAA family ATPase, partial [Anaerolineae bacterium]|nr:AAA family ATPase [Anaerolineae bacterium]
MREREQLEQAIAVLEGQRAVLGDAVVDAALGPMREKLAQLQAQAVPPEPKRRQVTVLFADLLGFTAISETLDAEQVAEIVNALWARLDETIVAHGGHIDKHIGDGVMALWGAETAREDDPERGVRAALAMQATLAAFRQNLAKTHRDAPLHMRIGLNTGPVLLGEVGSTREFTAMGDTVNLASRLEQAAPADSVLISRDTYRHVRGLFDVLPQPPLAVKGKAAPVQTYVVQQARPRAFRAGTRGVEGVETRMVGRAAELQALQSAFVDAAEGGTTRLVTVVADAGVGKSRLLYEFENWLALRPQEGYVLKGRAAPALQGTPYSIVRDMFAQRFDILESDSAAAVLAKFRAGTAAILPPERADLVGHWIGFDFSSTPAVQNLTGSPDFGKLARTYLTNFLRAVAEQQPLAILLEDLHWADDSSLDLVEHLAAAIPRARLLIVALARPALFERRPQWGANLPGQARLALQPLSRQDSQALVDEILQRVESIPTALRELIVEGAEGNPFYVEELIKMLGDERVIEHGTDAQGAWRVDMERLKEVRVPPTLTGILQARLDSLPR